MDSSRAFVTPLGGPLAPSLHTPVAPPPLDPEPAKPLAPEASPDFVRSAHSPGVLYEPNKAPLTSPTYSVAGFAGANGAAGASFPPIAAVERPALSAEGQRASTIYGMVADFTGTS